MDRTPASTSQAAALDTLARGFLHFADTECSTEPLYEALCRLLAQRPQALRWLLAAALPQQRPNLLLAALHWCVQRGQAPALAAYYGSEAGSQGGARAADDGLGPALDQVLAAQAATLAQLCATRSTQTNEIGRCAVLWPALAELARQGGGRPLALLDFGCSAGLNLGLDRYHYRYLQADGAEVLCAGAPAQQAPVQLDCGLLGPGRPTGTWPAQDPVAPAWRVASRCGIDLAPVSAQDSEGLAWLRACLWPSDTARRTRFDAAVDLARREGHVLRRETDGVAAIERWLDEVPPDVQPVVVNTWVLAYLAPDALQAHVQRMRSLVAHRGLAWVSGEGPWLQLSAATPPAPPAAVGTPPAWQPQPVELAQGTLWWLYRPGAEVPKLLARSHPHGRWLQWLAGAG